MLNPGWTCEVRSRQCAPDAKSFRLPEVHNVIFNGGPAHHESITQGVFERALQAQTVTAACPLELCIRFGHGCFKGFCVAFQNVNFSDFVDHGPLLVWPECLHAAVCEAMKRLSVVWKSTIRTTNAITGAY